MWMNLFNENKGGEGFVFLVGNKIDLDTEKSLRNKASKGHRNSGFLTLRSRQRQVKTFSSFFST